MSDTYDFGYGDLEDDNYMVGDLVAFTGYLYTCLLYTSDAADE